MFSWEKFEAFEGQEKFFQPKQGRCERRIEKLEKGSKMWQEWNVWKFIQRVEWRPSISGSEYETSKDVKLKNSRWKLDKRWANSPSPISSYQNGIKWWTWTFFPSVSHSQRVSSSIYFVSERRTRGLEMCKLHHICYSYIHAGFRHKKCAHSVCSRVDMIFNVWRDSAVIPHRTSEKEILSAGMRRMKIMMMWFPHRSL